MRKQIYKAICERISQQVPEVRKERIISKKRTLRIAMFVNIFVLSGKRDSNPRPPAWKASALSTELFPQKSVGSDGFEPPKAKAS